MGAQRVTLRAQFSFPLQVKIFRSRAAEYMKRHPELDLTIEIPDAKQGTTEAMLRSIARGEDVVDILDLHTNFDIPLVLKGGLRSHLLDLTDEVLPVKDKFVGWEPCTWNGRVYALPGFLAGSLFYYRADLFSKLKIDPRRFTCWTDFIDAGLKIKRDTGSYMIALDISSYNQLQPLMLHAAGGYFNASGKLVLESDENRRALALYQDLLTKQGIAFPAVSFYSNEVWDSYRSGKIVGAYMPEWYGSNEMLHNLQDMAGQFEITLAPPFLPGGPRSGSRGGMCACVVRGRNEKIALDFLKFVRLTKESQVALLKELLLAPSMLEVYDDPAVKDFTHPFLSKQKVAGTYLDVAKNVKQLEVGSEFMEVQKVITSDVIPSLCRDGGDPSEILAKAQKAVALNPIGMNVALGIQDGNELAKGGDVGA